ncbi:hypothetical protein AVEN_201153-1 [Araneus ventricosus]|uniref:Secreted protein n=1 Tax=Araneus ventricosus TaxID=182803 RepID=A0A4Y2FFJ1_ARAVE|nr:hypothetical protein AVEN_201153-1 [Araneus ventricosus]
MKAGSALVPVMAVCWLEGGQVSPCNQPVCGLDTLDLLRPIPGVMVWGVISYDSRNTLVVIPRILTLGDSTCCAVIHEQHSRGCFPTG